MRDLLILGFSSRAHDNIRVLVPQAWSVTTADRWDDVIQRLRSADPPAFFLFPSDQLTTAARSILSSLHRKHLAVPSAVLIDGGDLRQAHLAGMCHEYSVTPIFGAGDMADRLALLLARVPIDLRQRVEHIFDVSRTIPLRFLDALDTDAGIRVQSMTDVAKGLGIIRSKLYRELTLAGLPPPGEVQALFRLWPGILAIQRGATTADAAFDAQHSESTSFRKALRRHLAIPIRTLRSIPDLRTLIARWAIRHAPDGAVIARQLRAPFWKGAAPNEALAASGATKDSAQDRLDETQRTAARTA